ncbi:RHS repeat-associated core domain-containing protein [Fluviicola sp.]|uniref:RHS repeat-associated core domain-containing protein n=1 Tax=Fluviicola sp. TaxID=1917219 RepID=UPI0031D6DBE1
MKTILKLMTNKLQSFSLFMALFMAVLAPEYLKAADERAINTAPVAASTSFWVYDGRYSDMALNPSTWSSSFTNKKVTNIVRVSTLPGLTANFDVKVNVTILSMKWDPATLSFVPSTITTDLQVGSSTTGTNSINDKQAIVLQDAHAVKVTINSVNFVSGSTALSNLTITSEIIVDRQYFMNTTAVTGLSHTPSAASLILTASELDLNWDYKAGAEWYELEYVHISKLGYGTAVLLLNDPTLNYNYYLNSTRVEVKGNHYTIPKIYDKGFLLYRVRAIGFNGSAYSSRVESNWTSVESGLLTAHTAANVIDIDNDYDSQMNWSHIATFAEDGKRGDVLNYADGMGRGRQSVSSNKATNQVVINNIYFDEMGRPAVSDLPTPMDMTVFNHQPNFNRADDVSNTTFNYTVFDASVTSCAAVPNAFSTSYGAGKYYSANNPDKDGANAGIPDAEGFPYNRITYKKDLLDRVDREGAAGNTLKTNGGKEVRYIDLTSEQEELNLLFGSDIGWSAHYQKSAVIDQNGQAMVSYTDMVGRTVATYLTGPTPLSLDALPDNVVTTSTSSLITNGVGDVDNPAGPSSSLSYTKLVTNTGNYSFHYGFTPQEYTKVCGSNSICLDCVYDFNMKITDECGTVYFNKTKKISGENLDAACSVETFSADTTVFLNSQIGQLTGVSYIITKNLSVNKDAIDDYWCYYLEVACIDDVPDIFNELYDDAAFTDCEPMLTSTETGPCDTWRDIMLEDMSPGGQYAAYTLNGTAYTYTDPVSILNLSGTGTKYNTVTYEDAFGAPITVVNNAGATVSPAALPEAEFIEKFQPEWALSLLPLHPEYCFYRNCVVANSGPSLAFDEAMLNTHSFQDAYNAGYFNPVPGGTIVSNLTDFIGAASTSDPYFSAHPTAASSMNTKMDDYIVVGGVTFSMWEYAILLAMPCTDPAPQNCLRSKSIESCSLDYLWMEFRRLYLEAKRNVMYENPTYTCSDNCTIGVSGTYAAKQRRWPCWNDLLAGNPNLSDPAADYSNAIQTMCDETCTEYADEWLVKLAGCSISPSILTALRQDLINLCKSGCSASNPQGFASDMSGNTINTVLASYGIAETDLCSELLISEPGLYQSPESVFDEVQVPLDVCGCDAVMQAQTDLTAYLATNPSPVLYSTVEEMLAHNTGISVEEADPLLCACDKVKNDTQKEYVWEPGNTITQEALDVFHYQIPAALSCEDANCPDCETVDAAMDNLEGRFPNLSSSPNYTVIVTNYLNNLYDKDYDFFQYQDFFAMCNAATTTFCSENPATKGFLDMLTLLAYRGQFTSATPIDLFTNNAVYEYGTISDYLPAPGTADYTFSLSGTTATLTFGTGSETCTATITNPDGIDYASILSFDLIGNNTPGCSSDPEYSLLVTYLDCGQKRTGTLTISSTCFSFYNCICDNSAVTLCDVPEPLPLEFCYTNLLSELYNATMDTYEVELAEAYEQFSAEYLAKCAQAFTSENLTMTGFSNNYQYTLFYYDQAGNLVRTVAPQGVNMLLPSQNAAVNYARLHANDLPTPAPRVIPTHTFETYYTYNSYDQVESTANPDQPVSTVYYYDFYGRVAASQNPEQAAVKMYSYVLYDTQGRPVESGQICRDVPAVFQGPPGYTLNPLTDAELKADDLGAAFKAWVYNGARSEVTITTYDKPLSITIAAKFKSGVQQNLRLRVATVAYFEYVPRPIPADFFKTGYTSAIHYSYDIHGNVIEQLQDLPELAPVKQDIKSTQYDFELISGNVNKVTYQANEADQFIHTYDYDVVNRLSETSTSPDGYTYSREAHYQYYDYGPLARKEIGELKVQAEDYTYTINGWLKLKNGTKLNPNSDAGKDGRNGYETANTGAHLNIPADVTGYTLGYFEGDYKPISGGLMELPTAGSAFSASAANLYNGNIRLSTTAIKDVQAGSPGVNQVVGASYRYDQLNRLKGMKAYFGSLLDNGTASNWNGATTSNSYSSAITYDRNGNIKTMNRYASSPSAMMDQLTYNYITNTNKLHQVTDGAGAAAFDDISNTQNPNNYVYDNLGQMTKDISEGITDMDWRKGDRKLRQMKRSTNVTSFLYDPLGRRIAKIYKPAGTNDKTQWVYTYYANESNGQTMAVYDIKYATNYVYLKEQHIYGGERLGMVQLNKTVYANGTTLPTDNYSTNTLGNKRYELVNHLGNVNAVITDRKVLNSNYSALSYYFDFTSTGNTGWTTTGCSGSTVALTSGRLRITAGSSCTFDTYKSFQVAPSVPYTVTFDLDRTDIANMNVLIYAGTTATVGSASLLTTITNPANGTISYTFTPTATPTTQNYVFVYFKKLSTENKTFFIDNLQIQSAASSPYAAVTVMSSDYYPFGMQMPGRHTNDDKYRYGYNGMEKDKEMHGEGNSYTTEFRQYDPRLGRWLSLDPLMGEFPWMSPYVAFDNNPILYIDPYGLESTSKPGGGFHKRKHRWTHLRGNDKFGSIAKRIVGGIVRGFQTLVRALHGGKHARIPMSAGHRRSTFTKTITINMRADRTEYLMLRGEDGEGLLPSDRIISITATSIGDKQRRQYWPFGPAFEITSWNEKKYKFEGIGMNSGWFSKLVENNTGLAGNVAGTHYIPMLPIVMAAGYTVIKGALAGIDLTMKLVQLITYGTEALFTLEAFKLIRNQNLSFLPFWKQQPDLLKIDTKGKQNQSIDITIKYRRIDKTKPRGLLNRLLDMGL